MLLLSEHLIRHRQNYQLSFFEISCDVIHPFYWLFDLDFHLVITYNPTACHSSRIIWPHFSNPFIVHISYQVLACVYVYYSRLHHGLHSNMCVRVEVKVAFGMWYTCTCKYRSRIMDWYVLCICLVMSNTCCQVLTNFLTE